MAGIYFSFQFSEDDLIMRSMKLFHRGFASCADRKVEESDIPTYAKMMADYIVSHSLSFGIMNRYRIRFYDSKQEMIDTINDNRHGAMVHVEDEVLMSFKENIDDIEYEFDDRHAIKSASRPDRVVEKSGKYNNHFTVDCGVCVSMGVCNEHFVDEVILPKIEYTYEAFENMKFGSWCEVVK